MKLQIWDTAGQERYKSITKAYYRGQQGIFITFDLTSKESFTNVKNWIEEAEKNAPKEVEIIVFGNKSDNEEEREVTDQDISEFEKATGLVVFKCSAKTGKNVEDGFIEMA